MMGARREDSGPRELPFREKRLTRPLLDAMQSALNAALAGDGFDGGDFDGMNRAHFERALDWVCDEKERRSNR